MAPRTEHIAKDHSFLPNEDIEEAVYKVSQTVSLPKSLEERIISPNNILIFLSKGKIQHQKQVEW